MNRLLAAALMFSCSFPATRGALVHNFYGQPVGPTASFTGTFVAGENVGGMYHAVQYSDGVPTFLQVVDLTDGSVSSPETFIPLTGNLNPSPREVGIGVVQALDGGGVHYLGSSETGLTPAGATYWTSPIAPVSASSDKFDISAILDGMPDGTLIGAIDGVSAIGSHTQFLRPLPGPVIGAAIGISDDGLLIVGHAIWHDDGTGLDIIEPGGFFELPTDTFSLPTRWDHVKYDPALNDYVIGGLYLNSTTFLSQFGFWRFGTGELLATFDHTQDFRDWEQNVDALGNEFLTAVLYDGSDSLFYTFADESAATHTDLFGEPAEVVDMFRGANGLVRTAGGVNTLARYNPPPLFAVPGDFNGDGVVDGADFLEWQHGESPDPLSESDLTDWENNFGTAVQAIAQSSVTIPEPATALQVVFLANCLIARRFEKRGSGVFFFC